MHVMTPARLNTDAGVAPTIRVLTPDDHATEQGNMSS